MFITVEGGEGAGKSSFCLALQQQLQLQGIAAHLTREPGGTALADRIRQLFANPPEPIQALTELFLVSAARCQHVQLFLLPQLRLGRWVLCDRFYDSSYIYQGVLGGIDESVIDSLTQLASDGLVPDLTFLLDCDVDLAFERMKQRDQQDGAGRYDAASREIRQKMREGYLHLAQTAKNRMVVLNANLELPALIREAMRHLEAHIAVS